jgi:ATP-dependent DNA helicase RecG
MTEFDVVNLEDRARTAISLGESHFREFKSAMQGPPGSKTSRETKTICKDIGEALVAFANADGGELLIGVEDDGTISGIDILSEAAVESLLIAPRNYVHERTPLPPVRTARVQLGQHTVIYFSLLKSTSHVHLTSDGRCVQRRDLATIPMPAEEIQFARRERASREYDRLHVDGASANDLNRVLVKAVADQISTGMSIEKCLQYLDLAEYAGPGLQIRRAALLLFANEPNRWHPRLQVRIIKVDGTELKSGSQYNAKSDQIVTGNILELLENAWQALRPQLVQTRLGRDARFETTVMYPELACREALVNAIAHRDYSEEGRGIEIYVFDDRMEVRNPGALLSSLTVGDLKRLDGAHQSRNSSTSRVLRELGYMRELGEGVRRMFELMKQNELTSPELNSDASSFCVTLRHSTIYTVQQKLWLEQFEKHNLNREQKAIVVLGNGGLLVSPQEIWDRLGIVDTEHYRQLIKSLQDVGILNSDVTKAAAQGIARRQRIPVKQVPRFKINPSPMSLEVRSKDVVSIPVDSRGDDEELSDQNSQIFISNIPFDVDKAALFEFVSSFGEIQNLSIPMDRQTGKSKGYAFVEFQSAKIAERAASLMDREQFCGRSISVKKAFARRC